MNLKPISIRRFALVLATALAAAAAPSSPANAAEIIVEDYAVYFGVNFASISTDSNANYDGAFGFLLGGRASTLLAQNFFFVPGIQVARRGFGIASMGTEYKFRQTYLEIPALFMVKLPSEGVPAIPYFAAGPNLGMKLASGCSADGVAANCAAVGELDANFFDLGFDFVAGAEFPMEQNRAIGAELRYHHGLTSFTDRAGSAHHRGIEVVGSFRF